MDLNRAHALQTQYKHGWKKGSQTVNTKQTWMLKGTPGKDTSRPEEVKYMSHTLSTDSLHSEGVSSSLKAAHLILQFPSKKHPTPHPCNSPPPLPPPQPHVIALLPHPPPPKKSCEVTSKPPPPQIQVPHKSIQFHHFTAAQRHLCPNKTKHPPVCSQQWRRPGRPPPQMTATRRPGCWCTSHPACGPPPSSGPSLLPGHQSASLRGPASWSTGRCCPPGPSSSASSPQTRRSGPAACPSPGHRRQGRGQLTGLWSEAVDAVAIGILLSTPRLGLCHNTLIPFFCATSSNSVFLQVSLFLCLLLLTLPTVSSLPLVSVCACVHACVRACVHACMCACVLILREGVVLDDKFV